ncbi:MAG: hypothetical protein ACYDH0_12555 [Candidatus Aminicenantales bacterium]
MKKKLIVAASWGLVLAALAAVFIGVIEGKFSRYYNFYNADALYIPALYADLASGRGLSGWNPSAVPYFFPDIPVFFLIRFLAGNVHLAIALYGVIQFLAFIAGLILISDQVFGRRESVRFLILAAGTVTGLLFATGEFSALMPMLVSAHHFGALLSAVFCLFLISRLLRVEPDAPAKRLAWYGALFLVAVLTIASDAIFLVQFLIPALFGFWLLFLASKISPRQAVRFLAALIPAAPLGYWLNRALLIFRPERESERLVSSAIAGNIARAKEGLISGWIQGYWFPKAWLPAFTIIGTSFVALALGVVIWRLYRGLRDSSKTSRPRPWGWRGLVVTAGLVSTVLPMLLFNHRWVFWGALMLTCACLWGDSRKDTFRDEAKDRGALFLLAYFLAVVAAVAGSSLVSGLSQSRYLLPALLIPLFFGWPFLLASSKRFMKAWDHPGGMIAVFLVLAVLLVRFGGLSRTGRLAELADFYPDQVRCLDGYAEREHLQNGIAQYWLARPLTMLSRRNLLVVQAKPDLAPDHWINNLNAYDNRFDFVLTDTNPAAMPRINARRVREKFGEPAGSFACEDFNVLAYNRPEDLDFQRQYRRLFNFAFNAAELESDIGRIVGSSRIADAASGVQGCLAKSPALDLFIGDYRFEIVYSASSDGGAPAGTWDVVLHSSENGEEIILKKGTMDPDGASLVSGEFALRRAGRIELRAFYGGKGVLRIDALRLNRMR